MVCILSVVIRRPVQLVERSPTEVRRSHAWLICFRKTGPGALAKRTCGRCIKPAGGAPGSSPVSFCRQRSRILGQLLDLWAYHHQARIDFSRPGKPTDNCHIETFNGSFPDECLNLHWFETLGEGKAIIEDWRQTTTRVDLSRLSTKLGASLIYTSGRAFQPCPGLTKAEN